MTDQIRPEERSEAALVARARALIAAGIAPSLNAVSLRLFNDRPRLAAIAAGKSFMRPPTMAAVFEKLAALEANPPWRRRPAPAGDAPAQHEGSSDGTERQRTKQAEAR